MVVKDDDGGMGRYDDDVGGGGGMLSYVYKYSIISITIPIHYFTHDKNEPLQENHHYPFHDPWVLLVVVVVAADDDVDVHCCDNTRKRDTCGVVVDKIHHWMPFEYASMKLCCYCCHGDDNNHIVDSYHVDTHPLHQELKLIDHVYLASPLDCFQHEVAS